MRNLIKIIAAALIAVASAKLAFAHEYKVGNLLIDHPVARATAPGQKVGGGYMKITNNGTVTDTLISGSADFSGKVEIHEMKMENDVMKMKALPAGLDIEPGQTVELKPGGFHIMFMKLKEPLTAGEKRDAVLTFKKAGPVTVTFNVETIEQTMKMDHSGHKKKKHGE